VDAPSLSYRRLVANVLAGAGGRLAAILIALGLATVLVRTLGVAAYGTWSFFFAFIGYNAQFDFGLSVALERAVARAEAGSERGRIAPLLDTAMAMTLALSVALQLLVLAIPGAWLAAMGDPVSVRQCLRVLPFCLACSNAAAVAGAGLAGLQRTATLTLQRTVFGIATALAVAGLALGGVRRLDVLLLAAAMGLAATAIVGWRSVARETGPLPLRPWRTDRRALRELVSFGGTLQLTTLVAQLGDQGLRLLLGSRFGASAMGLYDLASRAAIAPRSLMAPLLVALVPFVAGRERIGGTAALTESLRRATTYATLPIVAGTAAGLVVARPLMTVWIGAPPEAVWLAVQLFVPLLVSLGIQSIASPMVAFGRGAGRPWPEAIVTVIAQALALALAAQASAPAAAIAAVAVVLAVSAWVLWLWLKRVLAVEAPPRTDVVRLAAVAAGVAGVAVAARAIADRLALAPPAELLLVPAVVTVATGALAVAVGCVSADERRVIAQLTRLIRPADAGHGTRR
jgi:O-antigen/teichoic acid export membrane protein